MMNTERRYEIREINCVETHGYHVSKDVKMWGVYIEPFGVNTFLCKTKEEAEKWIEERTARA